MRATQFPECCGVMNYADFFNDGDCKHYAEDFKTDFCQMDQSRTSKGPAFDLIILTEQQYGGAKANLKKRGFEELGPRVRNENSGNYLVLLQRVNGRVKAPTKAKAVPKKKTSFSKVERIQSKIGTYL